ncbi:DUF4224 domain-containing protein [Propionivibrio dicarboxylicus]|uniref:DUF4224 domain-containing protein n=1 Tax=Propionivibrio dicarboxylicus TaxID=83767 RepID=A0A1G8C799_9RHOO|nr:DUF4224 domain-containing protein [Propionivibrio dicarboxylicus]SDH41386.1 protein of unknown function [Propionivibrio dicarboxylicus]
MFLTPEELADLTDYDVGQWSRQRRWLDRNGYPFELSAAGRPKVLRAYVEKRLGLTTAKAAAQTEPDFSRWERA